MKFVVDAQLPPALARLLREAGCDAFAVREIGLREASDAEIWRYAVRDVPHKSLETGFSRILSGEIGPKTSKRGTIPALLGGLNPILGFCFPLFSMYFPGEFLSG